MTMSSIRMSQAVPMLLSIACAPTEDSTARSRVGPLAGTDAFVGIAMDDDRVFAYVCDGTPAGTTLSAWFVAEPEGTSFSGANPSGATLQGDDADDAITGTLVGSDGVSREFTATATLGTSGLYFGELDPDTDNEAWGGWIVDGSHQRGAVVDRLTGNIVGSPAIDPALGSVDVGGASLEFSQLDAPLDEAVDELPSGG